jgi:sarcosine oxidase subunit gamma
MANALRIQPLQDRVYGNNGVTLTPAPSFERISLRANDKAITGLSKAIGTKLPTKPGTSSEKAGIAALWIGPDEWFVTAPEGTGLEDKINKVKTGLFSCVPVDHRNTAIMISGPNTVNALNSGCPRDLSLEAFPIGACSRTIIAKAEVILWRKSEHEFHIECWRSFSDYLWKYLIAAARTA